MRIRFENTLLCDPDNLALGLVGPRRLALNGRLLVDEAEFPGAVTSTFFVRGNESLQLVFEVQCLFASATAAESFALLHRQSLPKTGTLECRCGPPTDPQLVWLTGAVLEPQILGLNGVSVLVQYTVRGTAFTSDLPPGMPGEAEEPDMTFRANSVPIAQDATSVDVVFSAPMAGVPKVTCTVVSPAAGDTIWAMVRKGTVTINGFTADLSGAPSDADHELSYLAVQ